jgi:hypothetical protein
MRCHYCGTEIKIEGFISRSEECPSCSSDVHCCRNCVNYDTAAHNRCREPQAEWVSDREKANFCDYFTPNKMKAAAGQTGSVVEEARSAFEKLFKN